MEEEGVTRSFPVAIARERGECPLQRRSVLALWESRRATTLLAFCKKQMDNTDVRKRHAFCVVSSVVVCLGVSVCMCSAY